MTLDIKRRQRLQQLLDLYSELLTEHQRATLQLYLGEDWSYAEIAAAQGVSRTAVYDLVRRSEAALEEYEARLGMRAADDRRRKQREGVESRLDGLEAELRSLRRTVKEMS
jgi:predicted DNA-binding protein YlxM (UPF0122 family)